MTEDTVSIFDHFVDRTDEDAIEGRDFYIFANRVKNDSDSEGEVAIEIAELNSDHTLKKSLCRKSISIPAGECAIMPYGPDTCEISHVEECWEKYTLCVAEDKPPGTYYYGIKTWGEDEDEPAFTEFDTKPDKVKVVTATVITKETYCFERETEHYSSHCQLLSDYDTEKDGIISNGELTTAKEDYLNGEISMDEFSVIIGAYRVGSINKACPGCYTPEEPAPTNDLDAAVGTSILSGAVMLGLSLLRR